MSTKTQKAVAAVVATALAASVVLGGTLAWQSINQEATNIVSETINPGGRLHDDFDGTNKDIYVENFADIPIYARIQLREYLELGSDLPGTGDLFIPIGAAGNHDATAPGAVDTWAIHYFDETKNVTDNYVDFTWGGSTTYMPTFNMNKDSLEADINGTYEGLYSDGTEATNGTTLEADRYADHVDYNDPQYVFGGAGLSGTEIRDIDTNDIDEYVAGTGAAGTNWSETSATHYASTTRNATVISMAEWKAMDPADQAVFYGWVYDVDGWAYWSQPIEPKTVDTTGEVTSQNTTGLLLNSITPRIDDYFYYQIHVIAQFITANDLGHTDGTGFFAAGKGTEPSADALELLNTIGVDISGGSDLTLSLANGATAVAPGGTVTLTAADATGASVTNATWLVNGSNVVSTFNTTTGTEPEMIAETTIKDGVLTVATNEAAQELTVIAIAEVKTTDGSGNVTSTDTMIGSYEIKVENIYEVAVSAENDVTELFAGETLQFNVVVARNGIEDADLGVKWRVDGGSAGTEINDGGLLTVATKEVDKAELTIIATSQDDRTAFDSYTITVNQNVYTVTISADANSLYTDETLQLSTEVTKNGAKVENAVVDWSLTGGDGSSTITAGLLDAGDTEENNTALTITADYKVDGEIVASNTYAVTVKQNVYTVTISADANSLYTDETLQLSAEVTKNGTKVENAAVDWSLTGGDGSSTITAGLLDAGDTEANNTALTITADYKVDGKIVASNTYTVTVKENVYTVTISAGANSLYTDETLQLSAEVTKNGTKVENAAVDWSLAGGDGSSTITAGLLDAGDTEANNTALTVTADYKVDGKIVASNTYTVTVKENVYGVDITTTPGTLKAGDTLTFAATVTKNSNTDSSGVTWAVTGGTTGTTINASTGLLTIAAAENNTTLTVTATSKADPDVSDTCSVTVKNDYAVTITGATQVQSGGTMKLTANVSKNGNAGDTSGVTWAVTGGVTGTSINSSTGELTVAEAQGDNTTLTVTATSKADTSVSKTHTITIKNTYAVTVTAADNATTVDAGKTLQFTAAVTRNGKTSNTGVTWKVTAATGTSISTSGLLTVGDSVAHGTTLTVTATSTADTSVSQSATVKVEALSAAQKTVAAAAQGTKVTIDGTQWWVVVQDTANNRALLWAAAPVTVTGGTTTTTMKFNTNSPAWSGSEMQTYLNNTYLNTLTNLKDCVQQTAIKTAGNYNRSSSYVTTNDKVFLLSEADMFGSYYNGSSTVATSNANEYTYGTSQLVTDAMKTWTPVSGSTEWAWLRSPRSTSVVVAVLWSDGTASSFGHSNSGCVRPAMWVTLDPLPTT